MGSAGAAPSQAEAGGQDSVTGESPLVAPGAAASAEASAGRAAARQRSGQRSEDQESNRRRSASPWHRLRIAAGLTALFAAADPRLPWLLVLGLGVGLLWRESTCASRCSRAPADPARR